MNIEWSKIISQAITALVVATFMGAAAIVWKGATTVDTKVQQTREDMVHLIDALSGKLASYEVQLSTISNQLNEINVQLVSFSNQVSFLASMANFTGVRRTSTNSHPRNDVMQQKALTRDIQQQLQIERR